MSNYKYIKYVVFLCSMTMLFMVSQKHNKETLPRPNQSDISFHEEPAKTVAAITFGAWANDEKNEKHKSELKAA
ncbi:heme-binding protein [Lewinella sp. LCG006]|uniref:heme-binding protein n=1 Tax=Lewinella sp. LCG006 TaxID=3231911 RepID=UPI0034607225